MSLYERALTAIENFVLERVPDAKIYTEAADRRGSGGGALSKLLQLYGKNPHAQTLEDWKRAIASASDPDYPDWQLLWTLHENLLIDDHLESVIESRIAYTKRSAIKFVNDKKDENPDLKELFERPWYEEAVTMALGSTYRGRRLLELYELDDDNELKCITEIEQPYFNTRLGIVTKNPGDQTGWNYRDGVFKDNYVQVGRDNNLGMLTKMAPIVLAKKLGMGSWLDFIDKYGVPPLFITTDREDDTRLKQLWDAATKFKSSGFMVGRGQEKFEVGDLNNITIDPIEKLCLRADNMMSKRVLGGTGLTDEKGFVGSVGIQYKIAIDRFESDRMFWKYFFNKEIRPRLIKLSPVYAPLAEWKLDYDDTERLDVKSRIDIILKLAEMYDIDLAEIEALVGVKINGIKQKLGGGTGEGAAPKKS